MIHLIQKVSNPRELEEISINDENIDKIHDLSFPQIESLVYNTGNLLKPSGNILSGLSTELAIEQKITKYEPTRHLNPGMPFPEITTGDLLITFNGHTAIAMRPHADDKNEDGSWNTFKTNGVQVQQKNDVLKHVKYAETAVRHENYIAQHDEMELTLENRIFNNFSKTMNNRTVANMQEFENFLFVEEDPFMNTQSFIIQTFCEIGKEYLDFRMKKSNKTFTKKRAILRELNTSIYQQSSALAKNYWKKLQKTYQLHARQKHGDSVETFKATITLEYKRINTIVCENFDIREITCLTLKSFCVLGY